MSVSSAILDGTAGAEQGRSGGPSLESFKLSVGFKSGIVQSYCREYTGRTLGFVSCGLYIVSVVPVLATLPVPKNVSGFMHAVRCLGPIVAGFFLRSCANA